MAHKSKTQRAKAAAKEANRKERALRDEAAAANVTRASEDATEKTKSELKKEQKAAAKANELAAKAEAKSKKPKKKRFQFLRDVRSEMKKVSWPSRKDVLQWSGVVVAALIFFGVYVFILDSRIIVPALMALSGLGA